MAAWNAGLVTSDAISVSPWSPAHGLPVGGRIPDVYPPVIPDSEGSPTPSVDEMRGAGAVGEGRRDRLDEGAPHGFLMYAMTPRILGRTAGEGSAASAVLPAYLRYDSMPDPGSRPPVTAVHVLSAVHAAFASSNEKNIPAVVRHAF